METPFETVEELATPATIGPYRILGELGRGSIGVVYRAKHRDQNHEVALKTLCTARELRITSIRREIHTLRRISHPGIVRILDDGLDEGLPWYVMDLVEGAGLREFSPASSGDSGGSGSRPATSIPTLQTLEDGPRGGLPAAGAGLPAPSPGLPTVENSTWLSKRRLQWIYTLGRRLCLPLAYLHGEGVVHHDLKPANIRVREDGLPVIVDFGLASGLATGRSREVLEAAATHVGTVAYMAPEKIRGELVDARADLYSLGCILYELIALRPPFTGDNVQDLVEAHLEHSPAPPSRFIPEIDPELDQLLVRLLAKRPEERLGHASDVARILTSLGGEGLPPHAQGERPPRGYLYRPRMVGRESTFDSAQRSLDRLLDGQGGVTLIAGESGIGKTRMALELSRQSSRRRVRVLSGVCEPEASAGAMSPLRPPLQALADRCQDGGPRTTERLLGDNAALLAAYEPALEAISGTARQPAPSASDHGPDQVARGLLQTLVHWTEERPILLVIDDLQWADPITLELLRQMIERQPDGLLLVGTYRDGEANDDLRALAEDRRCTTVRLERLDAGQVDQMVADMLALKQAPSELCEGVRARALGNPFFVAEQLQAALAAGDLFRDAEGSWRCAESSTSSEQSTDLQPGDVIGASRSRIERLPDLARAILDRACILRAETSLSRLSSMSSASATDTIDAVDLLLRQGLLSEQVPGKLQLAHDRLRELVEELMGPRVHQGLHALAARTLQEEQPQLADPIRRISRHLEQAGELDEAARWRVRAGSLAAESGATHQALRDLGEVLDFAPEHAHQQALRTRGRLLVDTGRLDAGRIDLERALALTPAEDTSAKAAAHVGLSYLAYRTGQPDSMVAHAEQASALARGSEDMALVMDVENALGIAHGSRGFCREAIEHYRRSARAAEAHGDTLRAAMRYNNIGINQRLLGELSQAQATFEQVLAQMGERHPANRANVLANLGRVHLDLAEPTTARARFEEALGLAEQTDTHGLMGEIYYGLGEAALLENDVEHAARRARQALANAASSRQRIELGLGQRLLARVAALQPDLVPEGSPSALFTQSEITLRETGDREELAQSLLAHAQHLGQTQGDAKHMRALQREAHALFTDLGMQWRIPGPT